MYLTNFNRYLIVWLRNKIFGVDAERWKTYLIAFSTLVVFVGIFVILFILIFSDVESWSMTDSWVLPLKNFECSIIDNLYHFEAYCF